MDGLSQNACAALTAAYCADHPEDSGCAAVHLMFRADVGVASMTVHSATGTRSILTMII